MLNLLPVNVCGQCFRGVLMKNEIIRFLADHYRGVMVSDRVFFSLAGYCATAQIRNGSVVVSVELPSLAESIETLNEIQGIENEKFYEEGFSDAIQLILECINNKHEL